MEDDKNAKSKPGIQEEQDENEANQQTDTNDKNNGQNDPLTEEEELEMEKKVSQAETERD